MSRNAPQMSPPHAISAPAKPRAGQWVQTERAAHEEWADLILRKPVAGALLHRLCSQMGNLNAVVVSQTILSQLIGVSVRTIQRAVSDLEKEKWLQVVRIGKGKEAAYVVNDRVAWAQPRQELRLSTFSAKIIVSADDQPAQSLDETILRRIPIVFQSERQLPTGPGASPPSQAIFEGMEPDLPFIHRQATE